MPRESLYIVLQSFVAWVAELVDARDLKSLGACPCTSSILVPGTRIIKGFRGLLLNPFFYVIENTHNTLLTHFSHSFIPISPELEEEQ